MSGYAVQNDGFGWRAVGSVDDVGVDEWYCIGLPPAPAPFTLTEEQLGEQAKVQRDVLLSIAANRMGPLQDAVDIDSAHADEVELLKHWKLYRIALNRIQLQPGFPTDIDWPLSPDELVTQ
ncbi:tail fiber assembly protein [Pseudomonas protegens]|uniref:Tail fiber assembly protein n=1 Tax=Pseudomonas protegens TaxID=380021 RepID=A0A7G7XGU6_9PSED|nr:tail fiber assembly protein [Pseudomonas protegens]QNH79191.1 tail fiber assembly protein [Pseudomonas protegens]QNL08388.1 tail fiber assembly protein [Pseudomonas protegens]